MKKVQTRVATQRSPQEVYDYLADFSNQVEWRFDVLESELVEGERGRIGTRYRQRVKQGRREMEVNVEVTEADPPRKVGFRTLDSGPVSASGTWDIQARDGGAEVVADVAIETRGIARLFEPLMGGSLRRTAARYEQDLAERLEAGGPGAPAST